MAILMVASRVCGASLVLASLTFAEVTVKTEQLNPTEPAWKFKTIMGPSKSDVAQNAKIKIIGNQWHTGGGGGAVLVNGRLPADPLELAEEAWLSNENTDDGRILLDLGAVQPIAAVNSYSWHEFANDQGARGPQVYRLSGSVDNSNWTKIADVDTRPNKTGDRWNGQHGVNITSTTGKLGEFRYLLFAVQPTRSPKQSNIPWTNTLFAEIDVHTAATLAKAGDAVVAKPVKVEDVWVVFKTHFDIGYTDSIADVLARYRGPMIDNALAVIEANQILPPEQRFAWTVPGWPLYHILGPDQTPERRARIIKALKDGALAVHAAPFTLHTESFDPEDLVRGLHYSAQIARENGLPLPRSAKMTDVPEHAWITPTLLKHAGIDFFQIGCNGASDFPRFPMLFWWEGPDGSRLLTDYTRDYGSGIAPPPGWPAKNYLAMMMTGDNGGPPNAAEVESVRKTAAAQLPGVRIHFGTLDDFLKAIEAEKPDLPVVCGDTPDTWIHGLLSMPVESKIARNIRPLEPALDSLDTHLRTYGLTPGLLAPALEKVYEQSLLFGEHTWGMSGTAPGGFWYGDDWKKARADGKYKKFLQAFDDKRAYIHSADEIVARELRQRLDLLAGSVNATGKRIVAWNALPWLRSGMVEVAGKFLYATDVPANGYKTFPAKSATSAIAVLNDPPTALNTPFYKAMFDLKRGGIASLIDKKSGRELVDQASSYALGQFLHERFSANEVNNWMHSYPRSQDGWALNDFGKPGMPGPDASPCATFTPSDWKILVTRTTSTDIATLTAGDTKGLGQVITLTFTFDRHSPAVDCEWHVTDKTPNPIPEGGWLCFPFAVKEPQFTLGRPGGPINPATDIIPGAGRYRYAVTTGVTITGADKTGVSLCPIDSPLVSLDQPGLWKHSLDFVPKVPTVFVNLYNNMWGTNFPLWQDGSWSERVRLWPTTDLAVPSWEARVPLLAATADGPAGKLPKTQAGLSVSRPGVLVTAFGQNPDGQGTLLRVWDQTGVTGDLTVTLPGNFKTAMPVNLRGEKAGEPVRIRSGKLTFHLGAYAPASFLLTP